MNIRSYFRIISLYTETSANGAAIGGVPPRALFAIHHYITFAASFQGLLVTRCCCRIHNPDYGYDIHFYSHIKQCKSFPKQVHNIRSRTPLSLSRPHRLVERFVVLAGADLNGHGH
ncbi:MAG: hypothetical protein ACFFGZ_17265, partial [Candidatus Thorarchaeota archaeon]